VFEFKQELTQQMKRRIKPIQFSWSEIILVFSLLAFGIPTALIVPIGGGSDEETHMIRVWDMSALYFIPNEVPRNQAPFPMIFWKLSYRRAPLVRPVEGDFYQNYGDIAIDGWGYIYDTLETRSVYSPPLLLPQMIVMRYLGRRAAIPAIPVYFLTRIAGLLSYTVLAWLAVRLIPFGKWALTILAISPTMLIHAATVNADPVSNGIGFLFISGSLYAANRLKICWREWWGLFFLLFLLYLAKVNLVSLAILPLLLISPSKFKSRRNYVALIISALILGVILVGGWNMLAYSRYNYALSGAAPVEQVKYIISHPFAFAWTLITDIFLRGPAYLREWVAMTGYHYWPIPAITYLFYLLALVLAVFDAPDHVPDRRTRYALLFVFVAAYMATVGSLFVSYAPVGSTTIPGVQGRYFGLVFPLFFLALVGAPFLNRWRRPAVPRWSIPTLGLLSLITFFVGISLAYHVPCGSTYYQLGLCYQPRYKNWAPNARFSEPISGQLSLKQVFQPECNGMEELRFWVDNSTADGDGSTEFLLYDTEEDAVAYHQIIINRLLPERNWFVIVMEPDWKSGGKYYELFIQPGPSSTANGIKVAYTLREEYTHGILYENDTAVGQDLVFQYGCLAGWSNILYRLSNVMKLYP